MRGEKRFSEEVLPAVFARLDVVFPEFGWQRKGRGWVATSESFTHREFGVRADRVICNSERGYYIHGSGKNEHWLAYINNGLFPRGDEWHRVAGELAARVGQQGFVPRPRQVSVWERVVEAAQDQLASPAAAAVRAYAEGRGLNWRGWGLGAVVDRKALLAAIGLSEQTARELRVMTSRPGEDWWSGRLVGAIRDDVGDVVGVWGRAVEPATEKYLVAGGSGPFVLGPLGGRRVVLVEGFIDGHRVHGVTGESVVAAGGTSVSDELLELLEQASEVLVAFDGDAAGISGLKELVRRMPSWSGPAVSFVELKSGDVDVQLLRGGVERWEELVAGALPWLSHAVLKEVDGKTAAAEVAALRRAGGLLRAAAKRWPLEVGVAVRDLAKERQVDERFIQKILEPVSVKTSLY